MTEASVNPLLVILGPTASGKTALAARIAFSCRGEVISADSRQVYEDMTLGTGKDYEDYVVEGKKVPYHLIDIVPAGERYNLFEYQEDFLMVYNDVKSRNHLPILCGGTGLYIDAVIRNYKLVQVPVNNELRTELSEKNMEELVSILKNLKSLHNKSDIIERKRLIRAIEIAVFEEENGLPEAKLLELKPIIFGLTTDVSIRRQRITERLKARLEAGLVDEVKKLLDKGISPEQLIYYGLEYKFITQYLCGQYGYDEMFRLLNIAIHQFAKRQMTWFRKMEKEGNQIHWLDSTSSSEENKAKILNEMASLTKFRKFL